MNRFYLPKSLIGEREINITDTEDLRHLSRAMRIKKQEMLFVSDGEGSAYITQVDKVSRACIVLKIKERVAQIKPEELPVKVVLACSIPKWSRFEDIVDKCTQLGAHEIIPLLTDRTLVSGPVFNKKSLRINRIMQSAAKQSGVLFLPRIRSATAFADMLKEASHYDLCLLPNLSESSLTLKEAIQKLDCHGKLKDKAQTILVLIGPEGDFTPREINEALRCGFHGVSLGESVLRVDTAAISIMGFIRLYFEDV